MYLWLYVENNPGDAELVRTLLQEHSPDIQLAIASNSKRTLAFLRQEESPTLILVSLDVPRMVDVDLVREIRQLIRKAKPIVVFADLSDEPTVANCYRAGASCVFPRPFDLDDCVATLKHLANLWSEAVTTTSTRPYDLLSMPVSGDTPVATSRLAPVERCRRA